MRTMRIIPFGGKPATEVRPAYFLRVFGRPVEEMRIVSFGRCNFNCPYCKRGGQWLDSAGNIITSAEFPDGAVFTALEDAVQKGQRIRLSGGDPCMHLRDSMRIAEWAMGKGQKISIAHNGSSPKFVEQLLPYLDYAAIDMKAATPDEFNLRAGLKNGSGKKMLENSIFVQTILANAGIMVDVRTCVFSTTTLDDFFRIAELIVKSGNPACKFWTVRTYKPVAGIDWRPLPQETVKEWCQVISASFPELPIGLRAKWEPSGFQIWKAGKEI